MKDNLNVIPIVQSDTTIYDPPLHGLILTATGTIKFDNDLGDTVTFTIPAAAENLTVTALPFFLGGRVRRVYDTTTDIADANIFGVSAGSQIIT